MMKKKTLATLLTLTMLTTAAVPVFAEDVDVTTETGQSSIVTYKVDSNFTVTIPKDVTLKDGTGNGAIKVGANAMIPSGKSLTVTITNANKYDEADKKFHLVDTKDPNNTLGYTISTAGIDKVEKDVAFLTVPAGTVAETSATLSYTADTVIKAGEYEDTLTFTVAVK